MRIVLKPARTVTVTVVDGQGIRSTARKSSASILSSRLPTPAPMRTASPRSEPRRYDHAVDFGYKPGVGFDYFENYRTKPPAGWPPPPERARLVLDGTRAVRIRAVDSAGNPMPGVEIVPDTVFKKGKLRSIQISASPVRARTDATWVRDVRLAPADIQGGTSFLVASSLYVFAKAAPDGCSTIRTLN